MGLKLPENCLSFPCTPTQGLVGTQLEQKHLLPELFLAERSVHTEKQYEHNLINE
jgi:hypothetical protein